MNYQQRVLIDRAAQLQGAQDSDKIGSGLKNGIRLNLKKKEVQDERRQRKIAATEGLRKPKVNHYSDGDQFDPLIHQAIDGEPILNKDGSFRKRTNWKKNV